MHGVKINSLIHGMHDFCTLIFFVKFASEISLSHRSFFCCCVFGLIPPLFYVIVIRATIPDLRTSDSLPAVMRLYFDFDARGGVTLCCDAPGKVA